jgi:hypothetical protein
MPQQTCYYRKAPVELEVDGVVGAHLHVGILFHIPPLQPQHARLGKCQNMN